MQLHRRREIHENFCDFFAKFRQQIFANFREFREILVEISRISRRCSYSQPAPSCGTAVGRVWAPWGGLWDGAPQKVPARFANFGGCMNIFAHVFFFALKNTCGKICAYRPKCANMRKLGGEGVRCKCRHLPNRTFRDIAGYL